LKPAVRAPRPWTGEPLIDRLLAIAGYRDADMADSMTALRDAVKNATTPARYSTEGDLIVEEAIDHPTRINAARQLLALPGLTGQRRQQAEAGDPAIAIGALHITLNLGEVPTNGHANGGANGGIANGGAGAAAGLPYRHLRIHPRLGDGTRG
jgi:hypothetical protein